MKNISILLISLLITIHNCSIYSYRKRLRERVREKNRRTSVNIFKTTNKSTPYDKFQTDDNSSHTITIGILTMSVHKKMQEKIQKKLEEMEHIASMPFNPSFKFQDLRYKQELMIDMSQSLISWNPILGYKIGSNLLRKMPKYTYYPTSYAKTFFGWHLFDYLSEIDGDPTVNLISLLKMIQDSNFDLIKESELFQ